MVTRDAQPHHLRPTYILETKQFWWVKKLVGWSKLRPTNLVGREKRAPFDQPYSVVPVWPAESGLVRNERQKCSKRRIRQRRLQLRRHHQRAIPPASGCRSAKVPRLFSIWEFRSGKNPSETAPRGQPQIEVTFETYANNLVNVGAVDKETDKGKKITILQKTTWTT